MPDLTRQIAITRHVAIPIVHDAGANLYKELIFSSLSDFSPYLLVQRSECGNVRVRGLINYCQLKQDKLF